MSGQLDSGTLTIPNEQYKFPNDLEFELKCEVDGFPNSGGVVQGDSVSTSFYIPVMIVDVNLRKGRFVEIPAAFYKENRIQLRHKGSVLPIFLGSRLVALIDKESYTSWRSNNVADPKSITLMDNTTHPLAHYRRPEKCSDV